VVLAFDKKSKRLAWSSEIELPQRDHAVAGQRFLLHTGGGVVTIAVVKDDKSLKAQELNFESGMVASECELLGPPQNRHSEAAQNKPNERLRIPAFPLSAEERDALSTFFGLDGEASRSEQQNQPERTEQQLSKAVKLLERVLKRVKEAQGNQREQVGKD